MRQTSCKSPYMYLFQGPISDCTVCDDTQTELRHPPAYITDNDVSTFWLSRTWLDYSASDATLPINITIKFDHNYQLTVSLIT